MKIIITCLIIIAMIGLILATSFLTANLVINFFAGMLWGFLGVGLLFFIWTRE